MAGSFQLNVVGLDKLLNKLQAAPEEVKEQVYAEVEATAFDIAASAKGKVPKDMGFLSNAITMNPINESTFEVVAQKFYAPYVEFGTGANAANYLSSQDEELKAYATTFYVNGQGRMKPRPFLFPTVKAEVPKMWGRIKELIQNSLK